jgi:hypothetical protein
MGRRSAVFQLRTARAAEAVVIPDSDRPGMAHVIRNPRATSSGNTTIGGLF